MSSIKSYIVLLILFLVGVFSVNAQVDYIHYIPPFYAPPYNNFVDVGSDNLSRAGFHNITLTTSVTDTFEVTIRTKSSAIATVQLSAQTPQVVEMPIYDYSYNGVEDDLPITVVSEGDRNKILNDQGLIIESADQKEFYVNVSQQSGAQGDILTSKGSVGKGTHFFSGHIPNIVVSNDAQTAKTSITDRRSNFISVMATEDNTDITFKNSRLHWLGHDADEFTITLDAEESYVLGAWFADNFYSISDNPDDLNGTEIIASADIIVNTGGWCASNYNGNRQDMGFDQLVPVNTLGSEFIAVKGEGDDNTLSEKIIVVSPYDNNAITINGTSTGITLNIGEYHVFDQDAYSSYGNIYIKTSEPSYIYQSLLARNAGSNNEQTVGFIFIPKISCEGYKDVSIHYDNTKGRWSGSDPVKPQLFMVARRGYDLNDDPVITINGIDVETLLGVDPYQEVEDNSAFGNINGDWVTYKISSTDLELFGVLRDTVIGGTTYTDAIWDMDVVSNYAINAALSFTGGVIGGGGFYSGFGTRPSIESAPLLGSNTNGCAPGNMKLVADTSYYSTFSWFKDGIEFDHDDVNYNTGGSSLPANIIYPATRGIYTIRGNTDCGVSRESQGADVKTCLLWDTGDGSGDSVYIEENALLLGKNPFVRLNFTLAEAFDERIHIRYSTTDPHSGFPATPGNYGDVGADYYPLSNVSTTIDAGETEATSQSIYIFDDLVDEEDEDFLLNIFDVLDDFDNVAAVVRDNELLIRILDDDITTTTVNLKTDFAVVENEGQAVFDFALTQTTGRNVFVYYSTVDSSAAAGTDYTTESGVVLFEIGETQKTVNVPIIDRDGPQGNRSFYLTIDSVQNALLGNDSTLCTIVDKDGEEVYLYYADDDTVTEGDIFDFNIRISQTPVEALTFRVGVTEATAVHEDLLGNELDTVILEADLNILDKNKNPVTSLSVNESEDTLTFYVQLSRALNVNARVGIYTQDYTTVAETDYEQTKYHILFNAGDSLKRVDIPLINDNFHENIKYFYIRFFDLLNVFSARERIQVLLHDDDDLPAASIEGDKAFLEDEGIARFMVNLSQPSYDTIEILYHVREHDIDAATAGTPPPAADTDFDSTWVGHLVFLPGDTLKPIDVAIYDNDGGGFGFSYAEEDREYFVVHLYGVTDFQTAEIDNSHDISLASIWEDRYFFGNQISVFIDSSRTVSEGNAFTFKVRRLDENIDPLNMRLKLRVEDGTAISGSDYSTSVVNDVFTSTISANTYAFTVNTINDAVDEGSEYFKITLVDAEYENPIGSGTWSPMDILQGRDVVFGYIEDDVNDINKDPSLRSDTFVIAMDSVLIVADSVGLLANDGFHGLAPMTNISWNGATTTANYSVSNISNGGGFTFSPSAGSTGSYTIPYSVNTSSGGPFIANAIFIVTEMPKRYTINPGDTMFTINVATFDDALTEPDEEFYLNVFDLSTSSVLILAGRDQATGTIEDDDYYPEANDDYFFVFEDNILYYDPARPADNNFLANDIIDPADPLSEVLFDDTYPYMQHGIFLDNPAMDGTFRYEPDENFYGLDSFLYIIRDMRTDSVYDPAQTYDCDTAVVVIEIQQANDYPIADTSYYFIDEDDPADTFYITKYCQDPDSVGLAITEVWGNKYGTVSIVNDSVISYQPIWFGIDSVWYRLDDLDTYNDPDTFGLVVFNITGEVDRQVNILRDESVFETSCWPPDDTTMTFTIYLSNTSYKRRYVSYTTEAISGNSEENKDFIPVTGRLTFPPNTTDSLAQTVEVTVMGRGEGGVGDGDESNHDFYLKLFDESYGIVLGQDYRKKGTIINVKPGERQLAIRDEVEIEGDTLFFTVELVGDLLEYNYDFTAALTPGTATPGSGVILNYDYDTTGFASSGSTDPVLSIISNDIVDEDAGSISVTFQLDNSSTSDVSFRYEINSSGETAEAWDDYTPSAESIVIPAGSTQHTISVPIIWDHLDEEDTETFQVELIQGSAINLTFAALTKTITINDKDDSPTIYMEGDKSVLEDEGSVYIKVWLSRRSERTVTAYIESYVSDDANSSDFEIKDETIVFVPGDSVKYFKVNVSNNDNKNEDFGVRLINDVTYPINAAYDTANESTISIVKESKKYVYFDAVGDEGSDIWLGEGEEFQFRVRTSIGENFRFKLEFDNASETNSNDFDTGAQEYDEVANSDWITDSNGNKRVDLVTNDDSNIEGDETFIINIIDSERDKDDKPSNPKWGNLDILPGRGTVYGIIEDNDVKTSYALNDDVFTVYSGESVSGNILDNDDTTGYAYTSVTFDAFSGSGSFNEATKIQAEDYMTGGAGVDYYDTSSGNAGGQYRSDDVDIENCSDTDGGYNVGWMAATEWLDYDVNIPTAGTYTFNFRVASLSDQIKFEMRDEGGATLCTVNTSTTGGWQTWKTVSATATLAAGAQSIRMYATGANWNFNWFEIENALSPGGFTYTADPAFTGTVTIDANIVLDDGSNTPTETETLTIKVIGKATDGFSLPAYNRTMTIPVITVDDNIVEPKEDFSIELSLPDTTYVKDRGNLLAKGEILDNDTAPDDLILPDNTTTWERQPITFNVLANDDLNADYDYNLWLSAVDDPDSGAVYDTTHAGSITYRSDIYFTGTDRFNYTASSEQGQPFPGTIGVAVQSISEMENKRSLYCTNASANLTYNIPDSAEFNANTIDFWFKPVGGTTGLIVDLGTPTISRDVSGNVVYSGFGGAVNIYVNGLPTVKLENDKWSHIVLATNSVFLVKEVIVGGGMESWYDEMRIWDKEITDAALVDSIMFQELYHAAKDHPVDSSQLKSLVNDDWVLDPSTLNWENLKFYAKFNTTDYYDIIGWHAITNSGTALSISLPFNHFVAHAANSQQDNDWDNGENWHFGNDYFNDADPTATEYPEYIIIHPSGVKNPYLHKDAVKYGIVDVTEISNLIILENADFTVTTDGTLNVQRGAIRISGHVFRKPNDRVVFMKSSNGIKVSKSLNLTY